MLVNAKTQDKETKQDLFLTAGASVSDNTYNEKNRSGCICILENENIILFQISISLQVKRIPSSLEYYFCCDKETEFTS